MDLVYIPDALTFGSFRSPQYRDYEQPWNTNYFDSGKATSYLHQRQIQQQQLQHQQTRVSNSKDSCYLCKENKRRKLAAYIRFKTRKSSCNEICEEEEEESEEQEKPSSGATDQANQNKASSA